MAVVIVKIPGKPVAQGRARAYAIAGRARIVDPEKSRDWKSYASGLMQQEMEGLDIPDGPVHLTVNAYWECPKGKVRKRDPRKEEWRPKLPDLDNVVKCVQDAANGVMFLDDRQVVKISAEKKQAAQGQPPCVVVCVSTIR